MCNLYSNTMPAEAMRRLFRVSPSNDRLGNQPPLPNIFPRHDAPVVRSDETGQRELVRMHWGFLLPQVSKKTGKPILPKAVSNARDDKVRSSPFWRDSFEHRRCLVPATSFCEPKGRAPATYYWFGLNGAERRPLFAFAGMWRSFRGRYREEFVEIDTFTILTTMPNELVLPIHPQRMPMILAQDDYETWLTGSADDAFDRVGPYPADRMRIVRSGEGETADPIEE